MRVLVLGSSGFLGRLVGAELAARGHVVEGWSRRGTQARPGTTERKVDLLDAATWPRRAGPWDAVLLLAGPAVPARFHEAGVARACVEVAANALALAARRAPGARVVVASSAHVLAPAEFPLDERAPLAPQGPYGAAKHEVELLATARTQDLDVRIARLFGSLGPGLPAGLFVPDLLARLAARPAELALAGPDARRDLTDGRDVAAALAALAELEDARGEVFHVGSGRGVALSAVAAGLARRLGHAGPIRFAPGAGASWTADPWKLARATGWRPARTLDASLDWIAGASGASAA